MRKRARAYANLVSKEAFAKFDQPSVQGEQSPAPPILVKNERIRRGNTARFQHLIPGLFEQRAQRTKSKEPAMAEAENPFSAVVELTECEHGACYEKGDVGCRDDDFRSLAGRALT